MRRYLFASLSMAVFTLAASAAQPAFSAEWFRALAVRLTATPQPPPDPTRRPPAIRPYNASDPRFGPEMRAPTYLWGSFGARPGFEWIGPHYGYSRDFHQHAFRRGY